MVPAEALSHLASSNRARGTAWIESSSPQRQHLQPHLRLDSSPAQMALASRAVTHSAVLANKTNKTVNLPLRLEGSASNHRAITPTVETRLPARSPLDNKLRAPITHLPRSVDSARRAILPAQLRPTHSQVSLRRLSRTAPGLQTHSRSARNRPTVSLERTVRQHLVSVDSAHHSRRPSHRLAACLLRQQTQKRRVSRHSLAAHLSSASPQRRRRQTAGLHSRALRPHLQLVIAKLLAPAC